MPNITTTVADPFIPEIWANMALEVLRANIVMARLVTRDTEVAAFQQGDILHIPYPGTFTANNKAANTAVTLQVPTGSTTNVTLDKHKETSFLVEDIARAFANQDIMSRYVESAMIPIAEVIENDLFALYAGVSDTVGTSGTDITAATIRAARKNLNDAKCPMSGRNLVVSTKDEIALLADAGLAQFFAFQGDRQEIPEGSLGRLYGFDLYVSQLVPVVAGAPNSTKNLAFNRGAFILAMRGLPEPPSGTGARSASVRDPQSGLVMRATTSYNPSHLGVQVTFDVLYGVAELRDEKVVTVLS